MPPKKRPSTPSPKPAPAPSEKPRRKPGPGRGHRFTPTREQRLTVEFMAGAGIPEDQISRVVINPQTQEPLHPQTLRKHFRRELDQGHVKADAKVAEGLYKNATTPTDNYPGGIPVAQIFWLKTRARWRTTDKAEPPALPQTPEDMDEQDTLRRLSFLLSKGAAEAERAANPHTPHRGRKKLKITA